jgi:hypothetical protein
MKRWIISLAGEGSWGADDYYVDAPTLEEAIAEAFAMAGGIFNVIAVNGRDYH